MRPSGQRRRGLSAAARAAGAGSTTVKHEGHAHVSVDFRNMPKGVKTAGSAEGVFKEVKLSIPATSLSHQPAGNKGETQMKQKASEIRAAFVAEAHEIIGQEAAEYRS